jgi:hypothetical protein
VNKHYINYAHNRYFLSQQLALSKARGLGFVATGYTFEDLDPQFVTANAHILSQPRGAGYWIWKPYLILRKLNEIQDGDYLMYVDSGAYLGKDVDDILRMINHKGLLTFSLGAVGDHQNSMWTKGDCFHAINRDFHHHEDSFKDNLQILASFLCIRKCPAAVSFIETWLRYCLMENLVTDSPSVAKPNFPDFKEHRHDQAILSLLVYNLDIMYLPDICQWNFEHGMTPNWIHIHHHRNKL